MVQRHIEIFYQKLNHPELLCPERCLKTFDHVPVHQLDIVTFSEKPFEILDVPRRSVVNHCFAHVDKSHELVLVVGFEVLAFGPIDS